MHSGADSGGLQAYLPSRAGAHGMHVALPCDRPRIAESEPMHAKLCNLGSDRCRTVLCAAALLCASFQKLRRVLPRLAQGVPQAQQAPVTPMVDHF